MEQYIVSHQIKTGTFGIVYEAHTKDTGTKVAIKKVQKKFYEFNQRQRNREAKVLSRICHPNLITLLDFVEKSVSLYFIFEYMDLNLFEVTSNQNGKPFPLATVQSYLRQILLGLEYLHISGYFHRDIKPENILVTKDVVKICDFGQVYELKEGKKHSRTVSTRWYRSPEVQIGYQYYGSSIDLWAVGAIAAELMTLKPLFPGKNDEDQLSVLTTVLGSPSEISFGGAWPLGTQLAITSDIPFLTNNKSIGTIMDILRKYVHLNSSCTSFVLDLLQYDPSLRPTATQALKYDFFETSKENICHSLRKIKTHSSESALCSFSNNTKLPEIKFDTQLSFQSTEENFLFQEDISKPTTQDSTDSLSSPLSIYFGSSSSFETGKNHFYPNSSSDSLPDSSLESFSPQLQPHLSAMHQLYPNNLPLPCLNSSLNKKKTLRSLRVKSSLQLYTSSEDSGKSSFLKPPRSNFSVKTKHLSLTQSDFASKLGQFVPPVTSNSVGLRRVPNIPSSEFTSLRLSSEFENCTIPSSTADKFYPSTELALKYCCTSTKLCINKEQEASPELDSTVNRTLNAKNSFLSFVRKVPSIDISFSTRLSNPRNQVKENNCNSLVLPPTSPRFGSRRTINSQSVDITAPSSSPKLKHQRSRQGSIGSMVDRLKTLLTRKSRPVGPHPDTLFEESSLKEPPPSDLWSNQPF